MGRGRNQSKLPTYIVDNEKKMTNLEKIANTLNNHFANIGTNFASTISNDQTETYTQYLLAPSAFSCIFRHITEEATITIIDKMENKSSSEYDGISNKILKYIKKEMSKPLTLIINQMLEYFLVDLKFQKSFRSLKKGDVNSLNNYRPISLLSAISKIFERIIYNQIYAYFDNKNILSEEQYGFRKKHST